MRPEYPAMHQSPQELLNSRREARFITPIPKPKKRKGTAQQTSLVFDEGKGLSSAKQQYDHTAVINSVRQHVDRWRRLPNPSDWRVTPETVRLLQHWRHHDFSSKSTPSTPGALPLTRLFRYASMRILAKTFVPIRLSATGQGGLAQPDKECQVSAIAAGEIPFFSRLSRAKLRTQIRSASAR